MCRTHWSRRAAGFTLVELLVVVIIIAIIAGILLPTLNAARRRVLIARVTGVPPGPPPPRGLTVEGAHPHEATVFLKNPSLAVGR